LTRSLAGQLRDFILVNLTGQATMLSRAPSALAQGPLPTTCHRHVTFTAAPPDRR